MHFYRICLIFLHIASAICYFPHLFIVITNHIANLTSFQTKVAYITYWFNYSLLVLEILVWCLDVICRKQTTWEVVQVSGFLLIGKLIYITFDVITRIFLKYKLIVIIFDFIHVIILFPAIIFTFLLVHHLQKTRILSNKNQLYEE
jgi:hypothetical protein